MADSTNEEPVESKYTTETQLSKVEIDKKIGLAHLLSILALAASVVMPFIINLWLVPKSEELKNRPRLQIISPQKDDKDQTYRFQVLNSGDVPAKNLRIQIFSKASNKLAKALDVNAALLKHVYIVPRFSEDETKLLDDTIDVKLSRPLGPGQTLLVNLSEIPIQIIIYSDYDKFYVYSSGGI